MSDEHLTRQEMLDIMKSNPFLAIGHWLFGDTNTYIMTVML